MLDDPFNWAIFLWILGSISGTFGLWVIADYCWDFYHSEIPHDPTAGIKDTRLHSDTNSETMQKMLLNASEKKETSR